MSVSILLTETWGGGLQYRGTVSIGTSTRFWLKNLYPRRARDRSRGDSTSYRTRRAQKKNAATIWANHSVWEAQGRKGPRKSSYTWTGLNKCGRKERLRGLKTAKRGKKNAGSKGRLNASCTQVSVWGGDRILICWTNFREKRHLQIHLARGGLTRKGFPLRLDNPNTAPQGGR